MGEAVLAVPKIAIKSELTKSFKNINYSQWERQRMSNNASVSTSDFKNATQAAAATTTTAKKSGKYKIVQLFL
jgi:hypothetical protein